MGSVGRGTPDGRGPRGRVASVGAVVKKNKMHAHSILTCEECRQLAEQWKAFGREEVRREIRVALRLDYRYVQYDEPE